MSRTILFSDIEGSTRLWEQHPAAMEHALHTHDRTVAEEIEGHSGEVIKGTGDGVIASFTDAGAGIASALAIQRRTETQSFEPFGPLRVRIGLHRGQVVARDGDLFGPTMNRAARIMACAHGGQTLSSQAVMDGLEGSSAWVAQDLGIHRLKDLLEPARLFQLSPDGEKQSFPRIRSLPALTNLPIDRSSFLGRTHELESLVASAEQHRLITLLGPGGVGKTRLATHAVAEVADGYRDGAWFVPLAAVTDSSVIPEEIGRIMGVLFEDRMGPLDALVDYARSRHLILLIDNCEHLIDEAAKVVERLLSSTEHLTVIATSREPLSVGEEAICQVAPLATDPEGAAVELFLGRAAEAGVELDPDDPIVPRVCARLDGLPLAIELAAAKTRALRMADLERRLDDRFSLLRGSRGGDDHHQTLAATIGWSYDLATPNEQHVLDRLSVFTGLFSLDWAAAVAGFEPIDEVEAIEALERLVDRSIVAVATTDDPERYYLLESIKDFAAARLEAGSTAGEARRRLVNVVTRLAVEDPEPGSPSESEWLSAMHRNATSLRAAFQAAVGFGWDLTDLVLGATPYWTASGLADEGLRWAAAARAGADSARLIEAHGDLLLATSRDGEADQTLALALERLPEADVVARARIIRKLSSRSSMVMNNLRTSDGAASLLQAAAMVGEPADDWTDERVREWISIQLDIAGVGYFEFDEEKQRIPIELVRPWLHRADPRQTVDFQMAENGLMYQVTRYRPAAHSIANELVSRGTSPANLNEYGSALFRTAFFELLVHDVEAAHAHLTTSAEIAEQLGDNLRLSRAYTYLTVAQRRLGMVEQCRADSTKALRYSRRASRSSQSSYADVATANLAWCDLRDGHKETVLGRLEEAAASLADHAAHYPFRWLALMPLLELHSEAHRPASMREIARELLDEHLQRFPDDLEQSLMALSQAEDAGAEHRGREVLEIARGWRFA